MSSENRDDPIKFWLPIIGGITLAAGVLALLYTVFKRKEPEPRESDCSKRKKKVYTIDPARRKCW